MSLLARASTARLVSTGLRASAAGKRTSPFIMGPSRRKQSTVPDGYKEDMSAGAMLRFEDSLPKLPVPTLQETKQRYLKSLRPLLSKDEFATSEKAVDEFCKPGGQGEELQKRLVARRDEPGRKNWIYEWWNSAAYLSDRGPVVPYVSYFYSHRDDRKRRDPAKRAAAITTAALEFKKQVDSKSLEPEYARKLPMAMSSYQYLFNCCRVPHPEEDFAVKFEAEEHPYIIVVRKNQFWKLLHEVDGQQLTTKELEQQFRRIYERAERQPGVGALTAERRSEMVGMRERLLAASPANKTALETIEAASFVVCLDDASPVTLEERAHQYWHGDGTNRWYDKPAQFIVNDNGTAGFMGEHSMMDGTPTNRMNDYVVEVTTRDKLDFSKPSVRSSLPEPTPVKFAVNAEVLRDITAAKAFFDATMAEHELRVQAYQGYGKGLIKRFKCSPDAYVQMIIQLAYHKMYGKNRPTYESAMTRRFQLGRTEACRSVSGESVAFCDAMADPEAARDELERLFRAALQAHVAYTADAGAGKGVDRHLFGLKKLVAEGEQMPAIFNDPAYAYSSHWFISTSQLSSEFFNGYGWSQVYDDGWGIAYMVNENSLQFNVVSKSLGCDRMSFFLNEAANDIRDMLLPSLEPAKAKL